ncbi:MAG TPA: phytanoyl-CoA dioxygenase family protein [Bryobacteraceae bacterium]|nr:phytanoyl-CoA dioxygenase family protein [Bryobacteraceae bacterium]
MLLSDAQRRTFFEQGTVRLAGAFSEADAARMADRIWELLEHKYPLRRDDPATWTGKQPTGFQSLTRAGAFHSIATPAVIDALNDLLGVGAWNSSQAWGVPLVTFPENGRTWSVPTSQWHLDFPARGRVDALPGVRVLAFLVPLESRGGGTVVAAGSHRLVERLVATGHAPGGHSATVRDLLAASHAWLRDLWSGAGGGQDRIRRFITEGQRIDGVDIRAQELTGAPGDVVLMHPWTFHAPAPNCSRRPRLMVSHSVHRS